MFFLGFLASKCKQPRRAQRDTGQYEFDFRFDIGITKPTASVQLEDVSHIIELIASHHTVISVKDHIVDGLRDAQILDLLRQNPCKMGELFISGKRDITADVIITSAGTSQTAYRHVLTMIN